MKFRFLAITAVLILLSACRDKQDLTPREGSLPVYGGRIWYRITGEGKGTPLILLHGGPGAPSYYLNPLEALGKDRPVIFFDQLGCGRSDRITADSLMTIESYVRQLEDIRKALNMDRFILYGQSWGTVLATEFYLKHPDEVKALILASPVLKVDWWLQDARDLIATLPDSIQEAIRVHEADGSYDSPEYQQAMQVYYENFVARNLPWSYDVDSSFAGMGYNVYQTMWGPSEFNATGTLLGYDATGRIPEIRVPTLFTCGEFDEARPATVQRYSSLVPGSQFRMIPGAGHLTMQDNPNEDIAVLSAFLSEADR